MIGFSIDINEMFLIQFQFYLHFNYRKSVDFGELSKFFSDEYLLEYKTQFVI